MKTHTEDFQHRVLEVASANQAEPLPKRLIDTAAVFADGGYTELAAMLRAAGDALMFNGAPEACLGIVDFLQRCAALQDGDGGESDLACVASHLLAAILTKPLFDPQPARQYLTAEHVTIFGVDFGVGVSIGNFARNAADAATCTCPSGDGSLICPCPAHPPGADPQPYDQGERSHVAQVASDAGIPLGGAA